jgi:hypothetical protein
VLGRAGDDAPWVERILGLRLVAWAGYVYLYIRPSFWRRLY